MRSVLDCGVNDDLCFVVGNVLLTVSLATKRRVFFLLCEGYCSWIRLHLLLIALETIRMTSRALDRIHDATAGDHCFKLTPFMSCFLALFVSNVARSVVAKKKVKSTRKTTGA